MMKLSTISYLSRLICVTVLGSCFLISCYKEPFYPTTIVVENEDRSKVEGAYVVLTALSDTFGSGFTNSKGEIKFEFDNAAVYDIKASKDNRTEYGIIKLIDQENVEEIITLP
jgi:hypothetical protein